MLISVKVFVCRCDYCGLQSEATSLVDNLPPEGWSTIKDAIRPPYPHDGQIRTTIVMTVDAHFCRPEHEAAWRALTQ